MAIPVVFITDDNFVMPTGVAIWSLGESKKPETEYLVYVVMAECSEKSRAEIMKAEREGVRIQVIEASLDMYRDIKQLAHIPISCLLKFNICELIPCQDKLIYLDGDILVRGDLTELYQIPLEDNVIAGVPELMMLHQNKQLINAGIMLFNAKKMREEGLAEKLAAKRRELGDRGSMDQQTFNLLLADRTGTLPIKFNCVPNKLFGTEQKNFPLEKLNTLYHTKYATKRDLLDDAVILHYATGGKPWKYSYVSCADEWHQSFLKSPYGSSKLKRKGALRAHAEGVIRNLRTGGIKAILKRLAWYIDALRGKNRFKEWG